MNPKVWKHLSNHEDILRLIFSRVSWDTNLRLRSVDKAFHAMLSEPSLLTWSSMLTDKTFYADHSNLKWVDGDADLLEQSHADPVCLFSTSQTITNAVVNFELHRWCKLPPLGDLPFGDLTDFTVTGVAKGLLLLERTMSNGIHVPSPLLDTYELDRFLFNPLTKGFTKLPVVPKVKGPFGLMWNSLRSRMIMAVEKELITALAIEFSELFEDLWSPPTLSRILIWHQGCEDWEPLKTFVPSCTSIWSVDNMVLIGGELYLHTISLENGNPGDRVFSCGSRAIWIDPEMIVIGDTESSYIPVLHLFQHEGVLKRLKLVHGTDRCYYIKLCTFDHLNGSWTEEEMEMPRHLLKKLCFTLVDEVRLRDEKFVDVLGDILCIGNRYKADVFFLYNLLSKQWSECSAKELMSLLKIE
ncbi:hypothetical protein R1sor_003248 [Riccia sorocarpa]|uniref:F-box domain-containing protein n=1 Tax=Riccia sorocarpa TaxID=122646 RepID=A0ABD3H569_9MARC